MEHSEAGWPGERADVNRRTVFFVSDQTGVTAETMGHSLLTQFERLEFRPVTLPFISTLDKAQEAARKINLVAEQEARARSCSAPWYRTNYAPL